MSNQKETEEHANLLSPEDVPEGVILKEHAYDGIQEFDQQLPRWWLTTLYGAIVFSLVYWLFQHTFSIGQSEHHRIDTELARVEAIRLENSIDITDDALFWQMSGNPTFVQAGQEIFSSNCVSCHGANLEGSLTGVSLVDAEWLHGAAPSEIYYTIHNGVLDKGMLAWGSLLGQKRIAQTVAFILSKNGAEQLKAAALDPAPSDS